MHLLKPFYELRSFFNRASISLKILTRYNTASTSFVGELYIDNYSYSSKLRLFLLFWKIMELLRRLQMLYFMTRKITKIALLIESFFPKIPSPGFLLGEVLSMIKAKFACPCNSLFSVSHSYSNIDI